MLQNGKSKNFAVIGLMLLLCNWPCLAAGLLKPVNGGNENDVYMKSHHVNVTINNGFARTEVDQVFTNTSSSDIEAIYSFPIPNQASLSEISLWINGKEVVGEVLEKQKARQIYNQEVGKKIDPALAEKNGHKTFDISVYPVTAKADTRLRLVYYQPIKIDLNIGRYVYPLSEILTDGDGEVFWSVDNKISDTFEFNMELKSAFPINDVRLPGYQDKAQIERIEQESGDAFKIKLNSTQSGSLDKDIVMYYKLSDSTPARVELIPYRKDASSTGTFMVVVTPAADLKQISEGTDWIYVLDTSGSMRGTKISTLIDGVSQSIGKMSASDRFRILTFNNTTKDITEGYVEATSENVTKYLEALRSIKANGSTNLYSGLGVAYKDLDKKRSTAVVLATDGNIEIDSSAHSNFLRLLEEYDVRLFTFIIGNGSNQPLMEQLAKDSGGFAMNISDSDDIIGQILQAKSRIIYENMHDVELKFSGEKVKNLTPAYLGNLYRGQQLVMFGQFDGDGEVELELNAKISGQPQSWKCKAVLPKIDIDNPEIERLWALSAIEDAMQEIRDEGENETLHKKVVSLGTEYSLVTDYTSMIVLEEQRFKELNIDRKNDQRVKNERQAQQQRETAPVKNYRVDNQEDSSGNGGTFNGLQAPNIGTGPVGPLFVALAMWMKRRKNQK